MNFPESVTIFNKIILESDEELRKLQRDFDTKKDETSRRKLIAAKLRAGIFSSKTAMQTARGHLAKIKNIYRNKVTAPDVASVRGRPNNLRSLLRGISNPEVQQRSRRITFNKHIAAANLGIERMKEALKKTSSDGEKQRLQNAMARFSRGRDQAKWGRLLNKNSSMSDNSRRRAINYLANSAEHLADAHALSGIRFKHVTREYPPGAELP